MSAEPGGHTSCYYLRQRSTYMFLPVFVCLSVSKIAQKRVHGFVLNVACRQMSDMDELINLIWIIVRMLEPDCFLRYRISAATRNFITSGKSHRSKVYVLAARRCSEAWFKNGFIHRETWEHLCRRHMRSTECPSSYFASSRLLLVYNIMYRLFYSFLFSFMQFFSYMYASAASNALIHFHYVQLSVPLCHV